MMQSLTTAVAGPTAAQNGVEAVEAAAAPKAPAMGSPGLVRYSP